jgi:hypothetical protein
MRPQEPRVPSEMVAMKHTEMEQQEEAGIGNIPQPEPRSNSLMWQYKHLHIGEHHKMDHLGLKHHAHRGSTVHLLTGEETPEGYVKRDEAGFPLKEDLSVYSVKGKYGKNRKCKKNGKVFRGI